MFGPGLSVEKLKEMTKLRLRHQGRTSPTFSGRPASSGSLGGSLGHERSEWRRSGSAGSAAMMEEHHRALVDDGPSVPAPFRCALCVCGGLGGGRRMDVFAGCRARVGVGTFCVSGWADRSKGSRCVPLGFIFFFFCPPNRMLAATVTYIRPLACDAGDARRDYGIIIIFFLDMFRRREGQECRRFRWLVLSRFGFFFLRQSQYRKTCVAKSWHAC